MTDANRNSISGIPHVDLAFPIVGETVPLDHGYALYGALCRVLPEMHGSRDWGVHPILGRRVGPGALALVRNSLVKLRLPAQSIPAALVLTGSNLELDGHRIRLGAPRVYPLVPSVALRARFVTVKGFQEEEPFALAVRRQIATTPGLGQDPERVEMAVGPRRVARIKDKTVVGFALALANLSADASIALQVTGLGGRRRMGAGLLVPPGRRGPSHAE